MMYRAASSFGIQGLYGNSYGRSGFEAPEPWEERAATITGLTEQSKPSQQQQADISATQSLDPTERGAAYQRESETTRKNRVIGAWQRLSDADQKRLNAIARSYSASGQNFPASTAPALYLAVLLAKDTRFVGYYYVWINDASSIDDRIRALRTVGAAWRVDQGLPPVGYRPPSSGDEGSGETGPSTTAIVLGIVAATALIGGAIYIVRR